MIDLDDLPKLPNAEQPIFVSNLDGFNKNVIIKAHAKMMVGEYDD